VTVVFCDENKTHSTLHLVWCILFGHRHVKVVHAASGSPPGTHNSWELAACKTSERFLHQQQQQQNQHHSSADLQQYVANSPAGGAGWYVRSNTAGGSKAELIAGTPNSATEGKVTLGVLLGAGENFSLGRNTVALPGSEQSIRTV
jgi:hypothetical protein